MLTELATVLLLSAQRPLPPTFFSMGEAIAQSENSTQDLGDRLSQYLEEGDTYQSSGDYVAAIEVYQQAIALIESQPTFDPQVKAEALLELGRSYWYLEEPNLALGPLEQSLALVEGLDKGYQTTQDLSRADYADLLIDLFIGLGAVHEERAELGEALLYYRRGLVDVQSPVFRADVQAFLWHNAGAIEAELNDGRARQTLETAARFSRESGQPDVEASSLFTLAWVAENAGDLDGAIALYQQSIDLFQSTDTPDRLVQAYGSLAQVYINREEYNSATKVLDQGFALLAAQDEPSPRKQAYLLSRSGQLSQVAGDFESAWQSYRQALRLSEESDYADGQIQALFNLGYLLEEQQQPALAIFFYKGAIAQIEAIRQDLTKLSTDLQESYTKTIEADYRHLADLLLQQDREAEALQILELLKLQEIASYLNSDSENGDADLNAPSETELQRMLDGLAANASLADFLQAAESVAPTAEVFDSQMIAELRRAIAAQPIPTAVLYPVILEDRLETLLISPDGTIQHFQTPVSQSQLSATVSELQTALKGNVLDSRPAAQQLYAWLIGPIEQTLVEQQVQNIIYLPDGVLRYVPLAALHDGKQWFAQRYQSHNITAATVDDLTERHTGSMSVLAGAFADTTLIYRVSVGEKLVAYSGLRVARQELENLVKVADTETLFDQAFTASNLLSDVAGRSVLHLATHAQFVVGRPEDSFILFGDGSTVNLAELREWKLPNVELVVLSACQTATSTEGEGKEILGLGYQIQQTGASSAIASLWSVDDAATAALMNQFYTALAAGESKAQALRTAQQALIDSDNFSNPHHWAAFILIGNGL